MPGSVRPSRNSREAPPPVDRWSNESSKPLPLSPRGAVAAADDGERVGAGDRRWRRRACRRRTARARRPPSVRSTGSSWRRRGSGRTPPRSAGRCRAPSVPRGISPAGTVCGRRPRSISGAATTSSGSWIRTPRSSARHDARGPRRSRSALDEDVADLSALRGDQRERHRAADQQRVDALDERADARRACRRPSRRRGPRRTAGRDRRASCDEDLDLPLQQPAGDGGAAGCEHQLGQGRRRSRAPGAPRRTRRPRRRRRARRAGRRTRRRSASSPGSNRRFSSRTTSPPSMWSQTASGPSPTISSSAITSTSRSSPRRSATGPRRSSSLGSPWGRPRCEATTSAGPALPELAERRERPRGSAGRRPPGRRSSGTLKSTRTKTRRPARSPRSSRVRSVT